MKIYIFVWIAICFISKTFSQNPQTVTLQQAIVLAKANNIDLKIAKKEIEKQTVLKKTALQIDPLQVQYQGGQFNSGSYDHNISVQQFFPIGNITKANRQLQEESAKLVEKRKAISEYEIEKAVTLSYYQYLFGVSIQNLNLELIEIYTKFLKNAELRFKTGESSNIEVISAKAKAKEIETQKVQIDFDLGIYLKQFQYFLQTENLVVPDAKKNFQYVNLPSNIERASGLIADFYEQQILVYKNEAVTFRAQKMPKVGLGYFAQSIDAQFLFQGFTAGLQIPVFGNVNSAKAKASEISILQTELELEKSKLTFKIRNQQLQDELGKYKKGVDYYQNEGLQYAGQIISTAQKSYENGDMAYFAYVSFLNQAIDIKKQYLETLNLYNQSAIQQQFPSLERSELAK